MPYIPQAGIGAIGIESGAHVKVADFGPTQTAQFKLHAQLRFATAREYHGRAPERNRPQVRNWFKSRGT